MKYCFNYNQKTDFFTGENSMYCNKCQKQNPASYTVKLYTGPQILIIILNRGVGIQYKVKLEFSIYKSPLLLSIFILSLIIVHFESIVKHFFRTL